MVPSFVEIAAGVAIFLFGMIALEEGFRAFAGGLLEKLLIRTTDRLWKSVSFGVVVTSVMQSSSLVSVITISFLSAGLITLLGGIGIIFGANIGTTTGAWLIAGFGLKVQIAAYAMPLLVFGVILILQPARHLRGIGYILAGVGFLFLGIHFMKEGFTAFKDTIDLADYAISGFGGLLVFALIGLAATVVMQSSHATLVLIVTALAAQQITYSNALALAIGANIGTTVTAIIGSMSANFQGKRLALGHLIFNLTTAFIAIAFIGQLVWAVDTISHFVGIAGTDHTLKLAVFHTLFNVIGVALMVPLIGRLAGFLERAIPAPSDDIATPKFLNNAVLEFPKTVTKAVYNETMHLFDNAFEIMAHGLSLHRSIITSDIKLRKFAADSREVMDLDLDAKYETRVKTLHAAILEFVSRAQPQVSGDTADRLAALRDASRLIVQGIKDIKHIRKNLSRYIASDNHEIRREYNKLRVSMARLLRDLHALRMGAGESVDVLDLDAYKLKYERKNIVSSGKLDDLIRSGRITAEMGSSIMNDVGYTDDFVRKLSDFGKILFSDQEPAMKHAEMLIALDDDDIAEMDQPPVAGGKPGKGQSP